MATLVRTGFVLKTGEWLTLKVSFSPEEFECAHQQAAVKSQFTMAAGQDGKVRDDAVKFQKQLMGILAEIACQSFLELLFEHKEELKGKWEVFRYDDVRTDGFKSAKNEYDIRIRNINNNDVYHNVESRSSITHDRSFEDGLRGLDIIGAYTSKAKFSESANYFYLRPLYRYLDFKSKNYDKLEFERLFINQRIELYLVAGCTFEDMKNKGYFKDMNQSGSVFRTVRISESLDIIKFSHAILRTFKTP